MEKLKNEPCSVEMTTEIKSKEDNFWFSFLKSYKDFASLQKIKHTPYLS